MPGQASAIASSPNSVKTGEFALAIIVKLGGDDDIVGAGGVVHPKAGSAAIAGHQVGEGIVCALGPGNGLPAAPGRFLGMRHENSVLMAATDGNVVKPVVTTLAHEDAQVVVGQNGIADDIVIESQIERNAGAGIVMEAKVREQASVV